MSDFNVHTEDTATAESFQLLAESRHSIGYVPNVLGVLAESPSALRAYTTLDDIFASSSLDPVEQHVVLTAISRFHECDYCVSAQARAADGAGVPSGVISAIVDDRPIPDRKLEVLRDFTTAVVEKRGRVSRIDVAGFLDAGFSKAQVLDIVLAVGFKTISNYANHIADTPLDTALEAANDR